MEKKKTCIKTLCKSFFVKRSFEALKRIAIETGKCLHFYFDSVERLANVDTGNTACSLFVTIN